MMLNAHPLGTQWIKLKNSLVKYVMDHFTTDEYVYKLLQLNLNKNIPTEHSFVGISYYYQKYHLQERGVNYYERFRKRFSMYTTYFPMSKDLEWRRNQARLMLGWSLALDLVLTGLFIVFVFKGLGLISNDFKLLSIFFAIFAYDSASVLVLKTNFSLSFPFFFQKLDSNLHRNPFRREKFKACIMDLVASSKWMFDLFVKLHHLIYKEKNTLENDVAHQLIIPDFVRQHTSALDQAVQTLEPDFDLAEMEFDEEEFETEFVGFDEVDAIDAAAADVEEIIIL